MDEVLRKLVLNSREGMRERERERNGRWGEKEIMCVCVYEREREGGREGERV